MEYWKTGAHSAHQDTQVSFEASLYFKHHFMILHTVVYYLLTQIYRRIILALVLPHPPFLPLFKPLLLLPEAIKGTPHHFLRGFIISLL